MIELKIHSAWHVGEIMTYMYNVSEKTGQPVSCRFHDEYTLVIIPDNGVKIIRPEWSERPEVHSL